MKKRDRSNNKYFTDHVLVVEKNDTLNDVLCELGFHTEDANEYPKKHIKSGHHILFTGRSVDAWSWLREMGCIEQAYSQSNIESERA